MQDGRKIEIIRQGIIKIVRRANNSQLESIRQIGPSEMQFSVT